MDIAYSKGVIVYDPFVDRSASITTRNDHATLDNMFWGCYIVDPSTLMNMSFVYTHEF